MSCLRFSVKTHLNLFVAEVKSLTKFVVTLSAKVDGPFDLALLVGFCSMLREMVFISLFPVTVLYQEQPNCLSKVQVKYKIILFRTRLYSVVRWHFLNEPSEWHQGNFLPKVIFHPLKALLS